MWYLDQQVSAAGGRSGFTPRALQRQYADSKPNLVQQWHPTKNGSQKPWELPLASNEPVWWRCTACPCGHAHEWQAIISDRVYRARGCPVCAGQRPCTCRSLAAMRPDMARQWDPDGNDGLRPEDVTEFSNKLVQWRCDEHRQPCSWEARVFHRTAKHRPTGCPECANQKRKSQQRKPL